MTLLFLITGANNIGDLKMKKFIIVLIAVMFIVTGFVSAGVQKDNNQRIIIEKLLIQEPIINKGDEFVELDIIESNQNLLNSGKPILPKIVKTYIFPFGTKITDVKVTFSNKLSKTLTKPLKPSAEIKIISTIYEDNKNID